MIKDTNIPPTPVTAEEGARIKACVEACEGIPTELLGKGALRQMKMALEITGMHQAPCEWSTGREARCTALNPAHRCTPCQVRAALAAIGEPIEA